MKSVCIVCGGVSHEHEISLISAYSALCNIDLKKYNVHTLIIDKEGNFFHTTKIGELKGEGYKKFSDLAPAIIPQGNFGGIFVKGENGLELVKIDVFFPFLHGENGEDGVIQGVFKMSGIPYVGSGVLASATCMDKEMTHMRLDAAGIKTAKYFTVRKNDDENDIDSKISSLFGYPVFVKPANAGSSVGVGKAKDKEELKAVLKTAFEVDSKVLIEECIIGAEVECAVLGNEEPISSKYIGQIVPTVEFYDFDAKYTDSSTALYIPAKVSDEVSEKVRTEAIKAYKTMDCRGLSRVDFFALQNGDIVLNEINNLPGFTSISMYPKLFEASGIEYSELIDRLIETAELK